MQDGTSENIPPGGQKQAAHKYLLPRYGPGPAAQALARQIGMDHSHTWAWLANRAPISLKEPVTLCLFSRKLRGEIPLNSQLLRGGDGLILELFGRLIEPDSPDATWPLWTFNLPLNQTVIVLQTWIMRAYKPEAPAIAEIHWSPNLGNTMRRSIALDGSDWSDETLLAAGKAMTFLHDLEHVWETRGRRRQYTEANESEFFGALKDASHVAIRAGENHLTPTSLARYGIGDRRTIKNALDLYSYDLSKVEAEARRCTQGGANICTFHVHLAARFKEKRA
jgi:hypothetical protein